MNTPAQCSLSFIHARDVPRTVILRRGPSKWVRCILWHRDCDSFEDGQWFKGRIEPEGCVLSPDGQSMIYMAQKEGGPGAAVGQRYTVVSRPPWLTALSLFPDGYWISSNGVFLDNSRYMITGPHQPDDMIGKTPSLTRVYQGEPDDKNTLGIAHPDGPRVNLRPEDIAWAQNGWRVPDPMGDYLVEGGRLSRRDGTLIRDFLDMTFEPIRAPYDDREEAEAEEEPWHPLDHE